MSHYRATEEQANRIENARWALSAAAMLIQEAGHVQPPHNELAALIALIGEHLPEKLEFISAA